MKRFSLLLFTALWFHTGAAQVPDFSFRHYTIGNELPVPPVEQMIQDREGFIWCEGAAVVSRYDGNSFHIYRHNDNDSFSLPAARAYRLGKGYSNRVIIACEKGIYEYDNTIDGFQNIVPAQKLGSAPATSPFIKKNNIWFVTKDKKIHCFDTKTGRLNHFAASKNGITCLLVDRADRVWVGTTAGLYRFYPDANRYEQYWQDTTRKIYGAALITDIIEDKDEGVWFSAFNSGTGYVNAEHVNRFFDFKSAHWRNNEFYILSHLASCIINKQQYILVCGNDGLSFLNTSNGSYTVIKHDPGNSYSLLSENLQTIFYDNTGTIWVSSMKGLSKTERTSFQFKTVHLPMLAKNKVSRQEDEENTEINAVYIDHYNHTVWIGTDSLGLLQYDFLKDTVLRQVFIKGIHSTQPSIDRLYTDQSGRLWLGTTEGVFIYQPATGKQYPLTQRIGNKEVFDSDAISADFMEDASGNMWVGSSHGVSIYNNQLKCIKSLKEEPGVPGTLQGQYVFSIYPKNDHEVWIATRAMNLYNTDSGRFVSTIVPNRKAYTPVFVSTIVRDKKDNFYFLGGEGLYALSPGLDSFYFPPYNSQMGSAGRGFSKLYADNNEKLWITTTATGLIKLDPVSGGVSRFTRRNGLARNQLHSSSRAQMNDPLFLFTRDGFQYFYPDSVTTDSFRAPLLITGISILEKPIRADYRSLGENGLSISYQQNVISFEFSLLDYSFTEQATYQYKLEGFDKEWVDAGSRRSATYTNLDGAGYVFRVRAKNHDNIDCGETIVKLNVIPPVWKQGWFVVLMVVLFSFVCYLIYNYLVQKYQSEKIINAVTASLYGQTTIEDMAWDIAGNCIRRLGFTDCVVYILDDEKNVLVQKAARGPKNPVRREILNPIEIPFGKGIVGSVAQSGAAQIISNTSRDKRYIVDDLRRLSEIAVPMVADGHVLGVIDSEHPAKNFYTRRHLYLLKEIATICSVRISKYILEEKLRNRIARDLHDDIGSALSSININSNMALGHVGEENVVKTQLEKIRKNSGNMMESMSDIIWAISPANDSIESLVIKMKEFAAEILESAGIAYTFSETGDFKKIKLNVNKRKEVYLIYKEALNNTAKYSRCKEVTIKIDFDGIALKLTIADDGQGFRIQDIKHGNGLRNMRERSVAVGGELRINSTADKGTAILLDIPVT